MQAFLRRLSTRSVIHQKEPTRAFRKNEYIAKTQDVCPCAAGRCRPKCFGAAMPSLSTATLDPLRTCTLSLLSFPVDSSLSPSLQLSFWSVTFFSHRWSTTPHRFVPNRPQRPPLLYESNRLPRQYSSLCPLRGVCIDSLHILLVAPASAHKTEVDIAVYADAKETRAPGILFWLTKPRPNSTGAHASRRRAAARRYRST